MDDEKEIEQSRVLRIVTENTKHGISFFNKDLVLVACNHRFAELLQFPSKFCQPGTLMRDLFYFNAQRGEYGPGDIDEQVSQRLKLAKEFSPHKFERVRPDGMIIEIIGTPVEEGFVSTYTDITELRKAQRDLVEAEKMASLGSLVGGVAHEINTPLGICVTAVSYFQTQIAEIGALFRSGELNEEHLTSFLSTAEQSAKLLETNMNRAAMLVKSFKQVAVDQTSEEKRTINLQKYLEEILVSLNPKLKKTKIEVILDIPDELSMETYPGSLAQIATNLIMNSLIHGFEGKSNLNGTIQISAQHQDEGIRIEYKDTGKGMGPDVLDKIFEPFFTTNRDSGGTGLGLHIVYNIITQKLAGTIECESTAGRGTKFVFSIPCQDFGSQS
ncbi:PAS-domain containing protein [Roseibium sp.]|uniref:PAS-domain containing protein n=1 Tax=Roseibium sp. TaxID=1936156 RepID=UPI003B52B876